MPRSVISVAAGVLALGSLAIAAPRPPTGPLQPPPTLYAVENLVAWCIVPFDSSKRGPAERAAMLERLGIKRVAYDWRPEHVPTFEQEILAYKKHGLEYFAFWSWHPDMAPLIRKHAIRPQIWLTNPSPRGETQGARIEAAGNQLLPVARTAQQLQCKFGLYNHGGWGGQPENLVAVCRWLRSKTESNHVGIVYNFHHGHEHMDGFAQQLERMKPYLLCLNINGMNDRAEPKIVPVGQGQHEKKMLKTVLASGYRGPIGILDHRAEMDAEQSLRQNLDGLRRIAGELKPD